MIRKDEKVRREFSKASDEEPSIGQKVNYQFIKPYIKNKKVLDVGCWSGQIEKLAIKDVKEIWGIDPGKEAISFAREKVPKGHFQTGSVDKLPFKDNSFDVVLLLEVLEHIPKKTEIIALKELHRVLKKGGYLLLSTPNDNPFSIVFDPAYFLIGHRHYSITTLKNYLRKTSFEVVEITVRGRLVQAVFNNVSLLAKHLLNKKINENGWVTNQIKSGYSPGGFLTNCVVAKKKVK